MLRYLHIEHVKRNHMLNRTLVVEEAKVPSTTHMYPSQNSLLKKASTKARNEKRHRNTALRREERRKIAEVP